MQREDKEGKLMLLTVYSVLDNPDNHFGTLRSGILAPKGLLGNQLQLIIQTEIQAISPIKADTVEKEHKFDQMCYSIFHIASATSAYYSASATANPELKEKVNFTLPQLLRVQYNEAQAFMQGIINVVTPVIDSLEPYGAKQLNLDDATDKLDAFVAIQTKPQTNIAERKVQNANIHPYVMEGKRILVEIIDPIVNTLFNDHHDLYSLYYNARQIINLPHGTTVVEGYVYKSDGVTPLYNATVKFADQNITVNTLLDGSFRVTHFPIGMAAPTASYGTAQQAAEPFLVKLGQTSKCIFKLDA
jgi:hypothetical protein